MINLIAAPTQYLTTHSRTALLVVTAIAFAMLAVIFGAMWVNASSDKDSLEEQLASVQTRATDLEDGLNDANAELEQTKNDLESQKASLTAAQDDLDELRLTLGVTQGDLASSRQETVTTRDQLSQTQGQLTVVQADVNTARQQLTTVQNELSFAQVDLDQTRMEAQHCRDSGQTFVNAANAFDAVLTRWFNNQATDAEVDAAAAQVDSAYSGFLGNCNLRG
jgi:chromosome segregation ATPase